MKKTTKIVSVLLSALTVSAAIASSASALIISDGAKVVKNVSPKSSAMEILKDQDEYIFYDGAWYRKVTSGTKVNWYDSQGKRVEVGPTDNVYSINPYKTSAGTNAEQGIFIGKGQVFQNGVKVAGNPLKTSDAAAAVQTGSSWCKGGVVKGGSYYTGKQAKAGVQNYFETNSYDVRMFVGEERAFSADALLFSTDPSVVYFDVETGKLVAKNYGVAEVYAYTTGMIPFFRIDVSVVNPTAAERKKDSLRVIPDEWELSVGDVTYFSVSSVSGKVYDDIVFDIWQGEGAVGAKNGKFTATQNGAVVVRAYSKSNRNVYGDALLYVGSTFTAASADGWSKNRDGILIHDWTGDFNGLWTIDGWIKGSDALYIPVIRKFDVSYTDFDGSTVNSVAAISDILPYTALLREAYGDKTSVYEAIASYNLYKNSGNSDGVFAAYSPDPYDYQYLLFVRLLSAIED